MERLGRALSYRMLRASDIVLGMATTPEDDAVVDELVRKYGWVRPTETEVDNAFIVVRRLIADAKGSVDKLRAYYDSEGNYAGRTFLDLAPQAPNEVGPADLLAVTLLGVSVKPRGVRKINNVHSDLCKLLAETPQIDLADAGVDPLVSAGRFYLKTKSSLGSNPWVIASKLCARKRPSLIPVRDREVIALLRLANKNYSSAWTVYRWLMADEEIRAALGLAAHRAGVADIPHLRLLDTLLWMEAN